MDLFEKFCNVIKTQFGGKDEIEDLIKAFNYVATRIPSDSEYVINLDIFRVFTESLNKMMIDSYVEMKKKNKELMKKAPEGDQTNPEASVQLSNSKEPFNTAKI